MDKDPGTAKFSFVVLKNGQTVEENKIANVAGVMQGKDLSLFLNTNNCSLSIDVAEASEKIFPMVLSQGIGGEKGRAYANLIPGQKSKLKVALNADAGTITITKLNKICSGNFEGTAKDPAGNKYILKGTFENVPLTQHSE